MRTIHIFHPRAELFSDLIEEREPDRDVVLLREGSELEAALPDVRVLFAPYAPRDGWAAAKALELIQLGGVGADLLLPSPDLPARVEIATMRGAFAVEVAEHAMMMLLALVKELPRFIEAQRERRWHQRAVGRLCGRRLAILGLGAIGRALAARASAFGMTVRALRRRAASEPSPHVERVVTRDALSDLLEWCDALVVCLPRTPETLGLIDASALSRLRESAILVDVARAGIVEPTALLAALAEERLAGAALDVFVDEPLPATSPFWTAPRTIVTPHVAGFGRGYLDRAVELLLDNVARLERGEPREGLVDRVAGY